MKKTLALILAAVMALSALVVVTVGADEQSGDWGYTVSDGKATINRYYGSETEVTIPGTIGGCPVTKLSCWKDGRTSRGIFYNKSVTTVTIPDSVTLIGSYAFLDCTSLTGVNITDLAAWCVITFLDYPLYYAHNLYLNGELVTDLVIPNGVTAIGNAAFESCTSLTSVTIPESVTTIIDNAFRECTSLESVTIGDNVTSIGTSAFFNCASLASVIIPDSVTSIGDWAFYGCSGLTGVTIGKSVNEIGNWAFRECSSLESVTIPESVTTIGDEAFSGCTSLGKVYYGGTSAQWGGISIESDNSNLTGAARYYNCAEKYGDHYYFVNGDGGVTIVAYTGSVAQVPIPASIDGRPVTAIGERAFSDCTPHSKVYFGGTSAQWGDISPRSGNLDLTSAVRYYNCVEKYGDYYYSVKGDGSVRIGAYTGSAAQVPIPATIGGRPVTAIGECAFRYCTLLTSVTIPEGVTAIESGAFYNCTSLTSVTIPDSVTTIGSSAFLGCSSLTSVMIPVGVTAIERGAFDVCAALTSVTIPDSVTTIGDWAFRDCTSLTTVYYGGFEKQWNDISKGNNDALLAATVIFNAVKPGSPGDVSGDGVINAKDVIAVLRLLTGWTDDGVLPAAADFNGDGRVNARDVFDMMKLLTGVN